MATTTINNLNYAYSVNGNERIIIDDGVTTQNTAINTLSSLFLTVPASKIIQLKSLPNSTYTLLSSDCGKMMTYNGTTNIIVNIPSSVNIEGFQVTISQLNVGVITLNSPGTLISYNNSYTTAGVGAIASIIRTSNNVFLLAGLLQ
jgi:predicted phosphoribosyltransferase